MSRRNSKFALQKKPQAKPEKPQFDKATPGPAFSFKFICTSQHSTSKCSYEQLKSLADKLRILSDLDWNRIELSPRTTNGYEKLPQKSIKRQIPAALPNGEAVLVFRFGSGSSAGRIAGFRQGHRFNVLFIDSKFDLYDH
jgi:hypothetical protein